MPASEMMPDVVVEIAFATGPNDPSPTWVDVSAYVEAESVVSISRGRGDELDQVQPSKCTVTFDNRDGRFTPGNTASPYYPNVKKGRRIRVSATWPLSGTPITYRRFSGYVDEWPVRWPDETSAMSTVTVGASSRLARLGRGSELRSIIEEEYLQDTPVAYYPMGESEGSTQAGNRSLTTQPALVVGAIGGAGSITFGTSTGPGTDGMTAPTFSNPTPTSQNGVFLHTTDLQGVQPTAGYVMIECFFASTLADAQTLVSLSSAGGTLANQIALQTLGSGEVKGIFTKDSSGTPGSVIGTSTTALNGSTHHAALVAHSDGGMDLYYDGVLEATSASDATVSLFTATRMTIGGGSLQFALSGTISHVAVTTGTTPPTAARILAHAQSGLTGFSGERSDQRIVRLARYAGVPASEVTVETGLSTSITNQITNEQTALALMSDVVDTESGVLLDSGNGQLTFHARSHRYSVVSTLTLSTASQELEASLEPRLDDQGLVNDMTANREGGVSVRAVDAASIDDYGLYRESITLLTTSDNEVQDAANWKVNVGATPQVRIPTAEVDVLNCTSAQKTAILAREIGDRITLSGLPSQAPAASMDFFIEGYTEDIGPESYGMTFNLSPGSLSGVWILDSSTYSVLDSTTRLAY